MRGRVNENVSKANRRKLIGVQDHIPVSDMIFVVQKAAKFYHDGYSAKAVAAYVRRQRQYIRQIYKDTI